MKAAFFKEHGGTEKILYADYRDPVPGAGEVIVRVRACALNHVDLLLLDGRFPPPEGLPHVNGCEVTGTLETVGPGVQGLERGARVIVFPGLSCGRCEYCLERRQHERPPRPRAPAPAPRPQPITPPAPHADPPLEPQAQRATGSEPVLGCEPRNTREVPGIVRDERQP